MKKVKLKLASLIIYLRNLRIERIKWRGWGSQFCLVIIIIMAGLLLYYLLAIIMVSEAEISLAQLKDSFTKQKSCHDDCLLLRLSQEKEIVSKLKSRNSSNLRNTLKEYFSNPAQDLAFRQEVIRLLSLAFGPDNPPAYLMDFFQNQASPVELRTSILELFSLDKLIINDSRATKPLDSYFSLLETADNWPLQEAIIQIISSEENKASNISADQLATIKKMILDRDSSVHLRAALILLLSDYYPFFPSSTRETLELSYRELKDDQISRYFAADTLNHLDSGSFNFPLPLVNQADWQTYYND